jgi:hypothetical protein
MNIILLEIPQESQNIRKLNSYLNNYLNIECFYFHIPDNLTKKDHDHLEKIAKHFFECQINSPIESFVTSNEKILMEIDPSRIKEIPWDIFYKFNKSVIVKSNVYDENLDCDISGFEGRIVNFYSGEDQDVYQIQYSAESLHQIPLMKLKQVSKISSPFYTYLEPDDIMPKFDKTNSNLDQSELIKVLVNIIDTPDLPGEIRALIPESGSFLEIIRIWEYFFKNLLQELNLIKVELNNHKTHQLIEIYDSDEFNGVWGKFWDGNFNNLFPLEDINKAIDFEKFNNLLYNYKQIMSLILPS